MREGRPRVLRDRAHASIGPAKRSPRHPRRCSTSSSMPRPGPSGRCPSPVSTGRRASRSRSGRPAPSTCAADIVGYEEFIAYEHGSRMAFRFNEVSKEGIEAFAEDYRVTDLGEGRCRVRLDDGDEDTGARRPASGPGSCDTGHVVHGEADAEEVPQARRVDPRQGGGPMSSDAPDLSDIDLTDASVWEQAAPHDWLDRLRTEDPVHWHEESDGPGFWALTRHDDVRRGVDLAAASSRAGVGGPTPPRPTAGEPRAGPDDHHRHGPARAPRRSAASCPRRSPPR